MATAKVQQADLKGIHPNNVVEYGSERHMRLLGLRKIKPSEKDIALQVDGYTLDNILIYGRHARPEYLQAVLMERVAILTAKPIFKQSEDRKKPNYSKPMFNPNESAEGAPTQEEIEGALKVLERARTALLN